MPVILIHSDRFAEHQTPPGTPSAPNARRSWTRWPAAGAAGCRSSRPARRRSNSSPACTTHITFARYPRPPEVAAAGSGHLYLAESHEIALLAAGAAIDAVERVMAVAPGRGCDGRPPGHHAERDRAMGFCLYNNVAVAAAHARAQGAGRSRSSTTTSTTATAPSTSSRLIRTSSTSRRISIRTIPGPGGGRDGARGGHGFTVNVPLEVGRVDEDYQSSSADRRAGAAPVRA